jgi:hypothetical protein
MACPTCDHSMAALGYCNGGTWYHCERCGTVKHADTFTGAVTVYVPKLVERCRRLEREYVAPGGHPPLAARWHGFGISLYI